MMKAESAHAVAYDMPFVPSVECRAWGRLSWLNPLIGVTFPKAKLESIFNLNLDNE
jgi:hypothetical protein